MKRKEHEENLKKEVNKKQVMHERERSERLKKEHLQQLQDIAN